MSIQPAADGGLIRDLTAAYDAESFVMIDGHYVPPATLERLVNPEAQGDRHNAVKTIVAFLVSQGMRPRSMYRLLVAAYPAGDFRDDIDGLVGWACARGPLGDPCLLPISALEDVESIRQIETKDYPEVAALGHGGTLNRIPGCQRGARGLPAQVKKPNPEAAKQAVLTLYGGALPDIAPTDFIAASPVALNRNWRKRLAQFFDALYPVASAQPSDPGRSPLINIVFRFYQTKEGKAVPYGGGLTFSSEDWSKIASHKQSPMIIRTEHGLLFRINQVAGRTGRGSGSGKGGSYMDADVLANQRMYVLIEADDLPMPAQLAFWWHHRKYVAALTSSGGKSLHALLWTPGYGLDSYRQSARALTNYFRPFGFDATENASRLSRLPGAERISKADAADPYDLAGRQQLLWLNPDALPAYKLLLESQKNASQPLRDPAA